MNWIYTHISEPVKYRTGFRFAMNIRFYKFCCIIFVTHKNYMITKQPIQSQNKASLQSSTNNNLSLLAITFTIFEYSRTVQSTIDRNTIQIIRFAFISKTVTFYFMNLLFNLFLLFPDVIFKI